MERVYQLEGSVLQRVLDRSGLGVPVRNRLPALENENKRRQTTKEISIRDIEAKFFSVIDYSPRSPGGIQVDLWQRTRQSTLVPSVLSPMLEASSFGMEVDALQRCRNIEAHSRVPPLQPRLTPRSPKSKTKPVSPLKSSTDSEIAVSSSRQADGKVVEESHADRLRSPRRDSHRDSRSGYKSKAKKEKTDLNNSFEIRKMHLQNQKMLLETFDEAKVIKLLAESIMRNDANGILMVYDEMIPELYDVEKVQQMKEKAYHLASLLHEIP